MLTKFLKNNQFGAIQMHSTNLWGVSSLRKINAFCIVLPPDYCRKFLPVHSFLGKKSLLSSQYRLIRRRWATLSEMHVGFRWVPSAHFSIITFWLLKSGMWDEGLQGRSPEMPYEGCRRWELDQVRFPPSLFPPPNSSFILSLQIYPIICHSQSLWIWWGETMWWVNLTV